MLGCRWVRPGAEGEFIPAMDLDSTRIDLHEAAAFRHRHASIEGAISLEHIRAMIEWMPRVGYNAYLFQFLDCHTFCRRWYERPGHPVGKGRRLTRARADRFNRTILKDLAQRGMLLHAPGHGWTNGAIGLGTTGWDKWDKPVPEEIVPLLAQTNGKRQLVNGVPLATQLCFSNPEARRRMVDGVVRYAADHPEVDYIHFYLADSVKTSCECAACQVSMPGDWYVQILNEADAELTRRTLPARLVLCIYLDLLWPPAKLRLNNPERFTLMFAPITRSFSTSYNDVTEATLPTLPPFELNKSDVPWNSSPGDNLVFLRAWQKQAHPGDGFDFDYHYWQFQFDDPGSMQVARVLHGDLASLGRWGLQGYMSCHTQRTTWPTGFGPSMIGRMLWSGPMPYDAIRREYFGAAFGANGALAADYLTRISDAGPSAYVRTERPKIDPEAAAGFDRVIAIVDEFLPMIREHARADGNHPVHRRSWEILAYHAEVTRLQAAMIAARARGDDPATQAAWDRFRAKVWEIEPEVHTVLDNWLIVHHMMCRFGFSDKAISNVTP
jgi:hypothetical protein